MRIYLAGLVVIFAACGERTAMLHELDSYAGTVELQEIGELSTRPGSITGVLTFHRASGNLQFQMREPEVVSLVRHSSGELRAFAGERWRVANEAETAVFELIEAAVRYRPEDGEAPMSWAGGYKITLADRQLGIRVLDESDSHRVR